jgi:hypothetical protein
MTQRELDMGGNKLVVFAQGMRRSGTTILYDLMLEDGSFTCFYEPLAKAKVAFGGGSEAHSAKDLFDTLRNARNDFIYSHPEWLERCPHFKEKNYLNYGAPRFPELEFEPDLPSYCKDYIAFLSSRSNRTFLKFTRIHSKVHCLKAIAPNAKFLHILRDPRHVVCSYLFGKNGKNRHRYPDADSFFTRISNASSWSSKPFSDYILTLNNYRLPEPVEDFKRILLIWKYKYDQTDKAGRANFGDNYMIFRHEDLLNDFNSTLENLSRFLCITLSEQVLKWGKENIKPLKAPLYYDDQRWTRAFEQLRMIDLVPDIAYSPEA